MLIQIPDHCVTNRRCTQEPILIYPLQRLLRRCVGIIANPLLKCQAKFTKHPEGDTITNSRESTLLRHLYVKCQKNIISHFTRYFSFIVELGQGTIYEMIVDVLMSIFIANSSVLCYATNLNLYERLKWKVQKKKRLKLKLLVRVMLFEEIICPI